MQSSAAVVCRALVMLAFLVGVPIVALSGTSWPELVKRLQEKWQELRLPAISTPASASTPPPSAEAPRFGAPPAATLGPDTAGSAVVPASYQAPLGAAPFVPPSPAAPQPNAQPPAAVDQFVYVQQRLRQLGATYYLLEAWGSDQQLYRFYCKMAVGGNASYTRYFEATDSNPLQAMAQVLHQVETWRDGGARTEPGQTLAGQ
jgi:hypothetical protein